MPELFKDFARTTLTAPLAIGAMTIPVADCAVGFAPVGANYFVATIGLEHILCSGRSVAAGPGTFTVAAGGRGYDGTVAANHAVLDQWGIVTPVTVSPIRATHLEELYGHRDDEALHAAGKELGFTQIDGAAEWDDTPASGTALTLWTCSFTPTAAPFEIGVQCPHVWLVNANSTGAGEHYPATSTGGSGSRTAHFGLMLAAPGDTPDPLTATLLAELWLSLPARHTWSGTVTQLVTVPTSFCWHTRHSPTVLGMTAGLTYTAFLVGYPTDPAVAGDPDGAGPLLADRMRLTDGSISVVSR